MRVCVSSSVNFSFILQEYIYIYYIYVCVCFFITKFFVYITRYFLKLKLQFISSFAGGYVWCH